MPRWYIPPTICEKNNSVFSFAFAENNIDRCDNGHGGLFILREQHDFRFLFLLPKDDTRKDSDIMYTQPSQEKIRRINSRLAGLTSMVSSDTDPQGMYTGVPENPYEQPVQDADDL